jgi:uncharacterized protein (TIGR03000 family)
MLGLRLSWLRASLLMLVGLLLASGAAWAHGGGGGHGGGGHGGGGHGGSFGHGGFSHGGVSHVGGFVHHGVGGVTGFGIYGPGFYRGLGYGYAPIFGRGYNFGLGYGYGLFGLGYGLGSYGRYGLGYGLGYPYYGYGYRWPYYRYNLGWYGGFYPYSYYGYNASPYYGYSSSYPAPTDYGTATAQSQTPSPPQDNMAHLLVIVPEDAELWFNGTKTKQTGPQREFVSPELTPGKHYSYEVKARWQENGKIVEQVRTAHVQANSWQTLDFTKPETSAKAEKETSAKAEK